MPLAYWESKVAHVVIRMVPLLCPLRTTFNVNRVDHSILLTVRLGKRGMELILLISVSFFKRNSWSLTWVSLGSKYLTNMIGKHEPVSFPPKSSAAAGYA